MRLLCRRYLFTRHEDEVSDLNDINAESSGSVDEAALEEEETVDEATVMAVNMDEATAMAPEVLAALPIPTIMAKVVEKLQWDRVKVTELGQAFIFMKKCVVNFHAVQARALSCLNNMLLVMPLPSGEIYLLLTGFMLPTTECD